MPEREDNVTVDKATASQIKICDWCWRWYWQIQDRCWPINWSSPTVTPHHSDVQSQHLF